MWTRDPRGLLGGHWLGFEGKTETGKRVTKASYLAGQRAWPVNRTKMGWGKSARRPLVSGGGS